MSHAALPWASWHASIEVGSPDFLANSPSSAKCAGSCAARRISALPLQRGVGVIVIRRWLNALRSFLSLLAATALLTACGRSAEQPQQSRYVGQVDDADGETSIGIVVQDDEVAAYVCPQDPVAERYAGWFVGQRDGSDELSLEREGWLLKFRWSSDTLRGTLTSPEGDETGWTASLGSGVKGLYAAYDAGCLTGVIVLSERGEPLEVRGAWCNDLGDVGQVTPISHPWLSDDRLAVQVDLGAEQRQFTVAPIELPQLWP